MGWDQFFQIAVRVGGKYPSVKGKSEILLGGVFYRVKGTWGWVVLTIQTFFKAKNSFLWILKFNENQNFHASVSKEYESETKIEQEQWLQLKMLFLLGYNFLFNGEGELTLMWRIKIWWWGESIVRGNFLSGRGGGGGGWANIWLVWGDFTLSPQ